MSIDGWNSERSIIRVGSDLSGFSRGTHGRVTRFTASSTPPRKCGGRFGWAVAGADYPFSLPLYLDQFGAVCQRKFGRSYDLSEPQKLLAILRDGKHLLTVRTWRGCSILN
jgi:hypothetical protein